MKKSFNWFLLGLLLSSSAIAQQNVFNRSDANTGDWGSGNNPWFFQTANNNQGNPDNNNTVRNDVFIGHNNFTSMSLNGRFYIHRDFTFQGGASSVRTLDSTIGGGFSFSNSLINASTATHIFNTPLGIDGNNAEIRLDNGSGGGLTFNGSVFTNNHTIFFRHNNGNSGTISLTGTMNQGGSLVKQNGGILSISGIANFSGSIFIDQGTLRIGRNLSSNTIEIGGGVQLSTIFNAVLELTNGGTNLSKSVTVKNFGTGSGNRTINFTHPTSTNATISGTIALEKIVTIDNPNTNNGALLTGVISGAGGITKTGTGILTLTAQNTYTGLTTINAGTLQLNRTGGGTLPAGNNVTCASGGTLRVTTNQTLNNLTVPSGSTLTVDAGAILTINGTLTTDGTINNNGTIVFTGATNGVAIGTGTVEYSSASAQTVAAGTYNSLTITNAAIKTLGGNVTVGGAFTLNSSTITAIAANTLTLNGTLAGDGVLRGSASSNLTIGGTGALGTLRMDQTDRGVTDVLNNLTINRITGGTVNLGNNLLQVFGTLTLSNGDFNIGSNSIWFRGPYIAGTVDNLKTTAGSQLDFQGTGTGPFTLPAFTQIGGLAIRDNNEYRLNSSPIFSIAIFLGAGILTIGANTLTNNGDLGGNSGSIRGDTSSSIVVAGTGAAGNLVMNQTTPGTTNVLQNITMNRANQTLTLLNALRITGTVTPTAGTIASTGNLTLVSNASGTARVAAGSSSGGYITGNVTAERYIPNGNGNETSYFRKWRLLSLPVNAPSLRAAWADGRPLVTTNAGDVGYTGSGTLITGHQRTNAGDGFDWWPALNTNSQVSSSSIRFYTPSSGFGSWSSASNTPVVTNAPTLQGYMLFVRGDRTNTVIANSKNTTLRPTGTLKMGTQNVTVPVPATNKFVVLGNPFASAINFESVRNDNPTLIANQYWMWDPMLNNAGGYRLVKQVASQWRAIPSPFNDDANLPVFTPSIESGQAVLVEPSLAGSLSLFESHKIANASNSIRPFETTGSSNAGLILANLYRNESADQKQLIDGTIASFSATNTTPLTDADDVSRLSNFTSALALALSRNNTALTVEGRPLVNGSDTLFLWLTGTVAKTEYELVLRPAGDIVPGGRIVLRDLFTNSETELTPEMVTNFRFTPTSDVASTASNRFQIVLNAGSILPVNFTSISASEKQGDVTVSWKTATETGVKHYEIEHSQNGRDFGKAGLVRAINTGAATYQFVHTQPGSGAHFYRIRSEDLDGSNQTSSVVKVNIGSTQNSFSVFPTIVNQNRVSLQFNGLARGRYTLQLTDMAGRVLMSQSIDHSGGSAAQSLQLPASLAAGNYLLNLNGDNTQLTERIVKR